MMSLSINTMQNHRYIRLWTDVTSNVDLLIIHQSNCISSQQPLKPKADLLNKTGPYGKSHKVKPQCDGDSLFDRLRVCGGKVPRRGKLCQGRTHQDAAKCTGKTAEYGVHKPQERTYRDHQLHYKDVSVCTLSHKRHKPVASADVDYSQITTKMMTVTYVRTKEATNQSNVPSVIGHKSYHTTDGRMQPVYTVH